MASFWIAAFVGIVCLLALTMGAWVVAEHTRVQDLLRMQANMHVHALQQRLSQSLSFYYRLLEGLSIDPNLRRILATPEERDMSAQELALTRLLPNAHRVRILRPRHQKTDLASDYPLSFASLEMLRVAESQEAPPPLEIHQYQDRAMHLVGATAVRAANGDLIGLVHVLFDAGPIRRWLNEVGKMQGRIEVQQRVEGRYVSLFTSPGAIDVQGVADLESPIKHSALAVALWYRPRGVLTSELTQQAALIFALLGALIGLLVFVQYKRMHKALDADQAVLVHLLEDALAGRKPHGLAFKVKDFAYTLDLLKQRLGAFEERLRGGASNITASQPGAQNEALSTLPAMPSQSPAAPQLEPSSVLPSVIFRANDICGRVGETLSEAAVRELGRAVASQAYDQGQQAVIVARDARDSGKSLSDALIEGLNAAGQDVIDLGVAPAPLLYFATHFLGSNVGVRVAGKGCAADYNGLQVIMGAEPAVGDALQALRERAQNGDLLEGAGSLTTQDLSPDYIERIVEDVSIARPLKIVIDCASACAALLAPPLYRTLGCDVVELLCELDNAFPEHPPEPSQPENLDLLRQSVIAEQADLGIAFDADGERLVLVDSEGHIIWPDRVMMLLAADVLARHPGGDVIYDVKCSRALASQILQYGGRPVMWKSGPVALKEKLRETGALLAGQWDGHIIFRERWFGFDDAMYAGARVLEILSMDPRGSAEVFADFPDFVSTPEFFVAVRDGEQFDLLRKASEQVELLGGAKLTTIDGLRAEYEDAWGLMCAVETEARLSFRFEADSQDALGKVQARYRALLAEIAPHLQAPF